MSKRKPRRDSKVRLAPSLMTDKRKQQPDPFEGITPVNWTKEEAIQTLSEIARDPTIGASMRLAAIETLAQYTGIDSQLHAKAEIAPARDFMGSLAPVAGPGDKQEPNDTESRQVQLAATMQQAAKSLAAGNCPGDIARAEEYDKKTGAVEMSSQAGEHDGSESSDGATEEENGQEDAASCAEIRGSWQDDRDRGDIEGADPEDGYEPGPGHRPPTRQVGGGICTG